MRRLKMKKSLIALCAGLVITLFCGASMAQGVAASGCPVSVTDVRNLDTRIFVLFTNVSGKRLDGYEFGLDFYGVDGTVRPYPETFKSVARVGARKRFIAYWKSIHT